MTRKARVNLYLALCHGLIFRLLVIMLIFIITMAGSNNLGFDPLIAKTYGMLILLIFIRRELSAYFNVRGEIGKDFRLRYELIYLSLVAVHVLPIFIPMNSEAVNFISLGSQTLSIIFSFIIPAMIIKELHKNSGVTEPSPPS